LKADAALQEVWKAKDKLAAKYHYDIDAMFRDLQVRQKTSGRKYIYPKPRKLKAA